MTSEPINVLFLCTGNSARSILAEAILNVGGQGRFRAYSAGSMPTGKVNPHALALLQRLGYETGGYRSKSWDEFAGDDAPQFDFIITVCDNAAGEVCPIWPGKPSKAHWGIPDPAAAGEADIEQAFADAYRRMKARIDRFVALPLDKLDAPSLKQELGAIGEIDDPKGA
jgi:arsenate reductase